MMDLENMPERALALVDAGQAAVMATVVETWGSAPRQVGAQMVVSGMGEMAGSVSGGCVEGAVVVAAEEALASGKAQLLDFGVSDEAAFAVGLACGGRIRVLVEPVGAALPVAVLRDLVAARAARRPVALVSDLAGGAHRLVGPTAFAERFRMDRAGMSEDGQSFIHIHNPPLRLFVVGAVHIAQALVPMARIAGHDVTVIDPRGAFGSAARFPDVALVAEWPDEALTALGLDARSAVVTLTHDAKLDDPAIMTALASDVYYLGCLGSTRTHAKRVSRLVAAGFAQAQIARIHAPVGLDIGARGPGEIAVSVLAEITQRLRRG
ncbi:XdhC/CoxI family protein [Rhodobacterales bacterium LSUCC0031]|nr:XdhC/CoxI family protein [Rhodobacterales bacterium LSUCC0031]